MSKRERDFEKRERLASFWRRQPTDRLIDLYKTVGLGAAMHVIGTILEDRGVDINNIPDNVVDLETIIQHLRSNERFNVEDLYISTADDSTLVFEGWSQYQFFDSLTDAIALEELNEIKEQVAKFCKLSKIIEQLVNTRNIQYQLNFDDNGKASFPVCSEKNGVINWYRN